MNFLSTGGHINVEILIKLISHLQYITLCLHQHVLLVWCSSSVVCLINEVNYYYYSMLGPVSTWMSDCLQDIWALSDDTAFSRVRKLCMRLVGANYA